MTTEHYQKYKRFLQNHFQTYCEQRQYVVAIRQGKATIKTLELTTELYLLMVGAVQLYEEAQQFVAQHEEEHHLQPTIFD